MNQKLALSVGVGAALLLFTGVASAETGIVPTDEEIEFLTQLLNIVDTFVESLDGLLTDTQN